jgi:hypothetical protein
MKTNSYRKNLYSLTKKAVLTWNIVDTDRVKSDKKNHFSAWTSVTGHNCWRTIEGDSFQGEPQMSIQRYRRRSECLDGHAGSKKVIKLLRYKIKLTIRTMRMTHDPSTQVGRAKHRRSLWLMNCTYWPKLPAMERHIVCLVLEWNVTRSSTTGPRPTQSK